MGGHPSADRCLIRGRLPAERGVGDARLPVFDVTCQLPPERGVAVTGDTDVVPALGATADEQLQLAVALQRVAAGATGAIIGNGDSCCGPSLPIRIERLWLDAMTVVRSQRC